MSGPASGHGTPYELRVREAVWETDPRFGILAWGIGSIFLGLIISVLLIHGEMRLLVLVLLGLLGIACLSPPRGIVILTAFLPFMYFTRRLVLEYQEFAQRDPILVFPAIVTCIMCASVMIFHRQRVFYYFRRSPLLTAAALLMFVLVLQMFNPLQGSIFVGLAGGMFFLVPMMWLVLGLVTTRESLARLLNMVLVIGCITGLYGIYQHYFGLSEIEIYEMQSKHFLKTFGSLEDVRVMSTFAGLVDFARYLTVSGFIAFAWFWRTRWLFGLFLFALQIVALLFTAQRTSFLVILFSIVMLIIVQGKGTRRIIARGLGASLVILLLYGIAYTFEPKEVYNQRFSKNPFVVHTVSGVTHPTEEATLHSRLDAWGGILLGAFTNNPIGRGLGSTTPAASKFEGGRYYEADSYFFELFYGSSVVAPLLFGVIAFILMRDLLRLCIDDPRDHLLRVCFAIMCGALLSSVFGITPRDNITGPLMWLIIGWVVRESVDRAPVTSGRSPAVRSDALATEEGR